jgi:short-subunit dehydrogenase
MTNNAVQVSDKTVLITGTTSGIGYELSRICARNGFNLVLVSRDEKKLRAQKEALQSEYRVAVRTVSRDLSDPSSPAEVFNEIKRQGLNAGFNESGPFLHTSLDKELAMLQVHVTALTHMTKLFLPDMIKRGFGKILNVGSTGSFTPCALDAVYCATKAYVLSFSNAIRAELSGTGVSVSTLCPGATNTEFARKARMESTRLFKGIVMEPKKVAETAFQGLMENKKVIVPGFANRMLVASIPFTPDGILDRVSVFLLKKN